jgi:hypothetical protein
VDSVGAGATSGFLLPADKDLLKFRKYNSTTIVKIRLTILELD